MIMIIITITITIIIITIVIIVIFIVIIIIIININIIIIIIIIILTISTSRHTCEPSVMGVQGLHETCSASYTSQAPPGTKIYKHMQFWVQWARSSSSP